LPVVAYVTFTVVEASEAPSAGAVMRIRAAPSAVFMSVWISLCDSARL
jgi:hypothetical protein